MGRRQEKSSVAGSAAWAAGRGPLRLVFADRQSSEISGPTTWASHKTYLKNCLATFLSSEAAEYFGLLMTDL